MKTPVRLVVAASLAICMVSAGPFQSAARETASVQSSGEVLDALASLPIQGIPPILMQGAQGVAIIPNLIKAGFVLGGRHGRGVLLVRNPDGSWGNPVFVTLTGGSIGWQIGVQSTDVVLVFKTHNSLDRILKGKGKITLGADVAVAAGPLGRQAEAGTDAMLKAEIFSYSRSRGLFLGVSLEGAALLIDCDSNDAFYRMPGTSPGELMTMQGPLVPPVAEMLKGQLTRLSNPPAVQIGTPPPPVVVPVPTPPPPVIAPVPTPPPPVIAPVPTPPPPAPVPVPQPPN
jgi:lipid-binding SYLF domain-containing protein